MALRVRLLLLIFGIVWLVIISRLYYISVRSSDYYRVLAEKNAVKNDIIFPARGIIYDRNKTPLAMNTIGFSIDLAPGLSRKNKLIELDKELLEIKKIYPFFDIAKARAEYILNDSVYNHESVKIVPFIPYDSFFPYFPKLAQRPLIKISASTYREYASGTTASHLLGYVSKANQKDQDEDPYVKAVGYVGKAGLERYYNKELQGNPGVRTYLVNAYNREVMELNQTLPSKDNNLILSVDLRLQTFIDSLFNGKAGAVVVMDVNNGSLLAAASYPEFNPSLFVRGLKVDEWKALSEDLNHPLLNKLTRGLYPPGSTVKPGVSIGFFNTGKIDQYTTINDRGYVQVGKRYFRDWKKEGHGDVNLFKAISESCDTYYYLGALEVGNQPTADIMKKMGFGSKSGIDLPGELSGTVPDASWKMMKMKQKWFVGDSLNTVIGQGNFLATPLQVARYTALIASGKLTQPYVALSVAGKTKQPIIQDVLTPREKSFLPYIRKGMYDVCNSNGGTGFRYGLGNLLVKVAGKTGTAQVSAIGQHEKERIKEYEMEYFKRSHAWFTGYGPFEEPRYAITVMLEHGGHGGEAAGPIAGAIFNKLVELKYITRPQPLQQSLPTQ